MTDKNSKGKISLRYAFMAFVVSLIVVVPLRTYQLVKLIEPTTGFFKRSSVTAPILYVILAVMFIAFMVMAYTANDVPKVRPNGKKTVLAVLSFLVSVSLIVDVIAQSSELMNDISNYRMTVQSVTEASYLMSNGDFPIVFQIAFAILACIYFIIVGMTYSGSNVDYADCKVLALTPLFWLIFRIFHRFMRKINFRNVSELLLEMLMITALMLFFLAFARYSSRVNGKGSMMKMFYFGLTGALLAFVCSVPRYIVLLSNLSAIPSNERLRDIVLGKSPMLVSQSPASLCDLAVGLFVIAYLYSALAAVKKNK